MKQILMAQQALADLGAYAVPLLCHCDLCFYIEREQASAYTIKVFTKNMLIVTWDCWPTGVASSHLGPSGRQQDVGQGKTGPGPCLPPAAGPEANHCSFP